jgi:15-cis-phytoene synthase
MNELSAAGITGQDLQNSYSLCKRLNYEHGKTYFLATLLLPKSKRPFVHALYGFARYADEIVDDLSSSHSLSEKTEHLQRWGQSILSDLRIGQSSDPIGKALVDTVERFQIPHQHFETFLLSMSMDLTITRYQTFEDLLKYVYGSAVAIGLEMVPVLGTISNEAYGAAEKLGIAFQLANFIRDVGEDLDRGRIYLPLDELAQHGVSPEMLAERTLTPQIISALKEQIERVRRLQREAKDGIKFLSKESQPCIKAATELYCGIVDEVEAVGYDIFHVRARTSRTRRLKVAGTAYLQTLPYRFRAPW